MIAIIKNFIDRIKGKSNEEFFSATEAYQIAKYNDTLTRDQLKEMMIDQLKRRIISDFRVAGKFIDITTYDGYREKLLLPEIAEFFREHKYHVDLLNEGEYDNVNVLIINWQNSETFR